MSTTSIEETLHYNAGDLSLHGFLVSRPETPRPGVLLLHDAFGVSDAMKATARRIAECGYTVLLADLWGEGRTPRGEEEIGPLIGSLVSNPDSWVARIQAAHERLSQLSQTAGAIVAVGYCFGGSSALEYVRHGGALRAAVSIHGGLDTVGLDWSAAADAQVLMLTGAEDPMAPPDALGALQDALTVSGVAWQTTVFGGAKHAFTDPHADRAGRPEVLAYDATADRRSWEALTRLLAEVNP